MSLLNNIPKQNRLNGRCPDLVRCSLAIACSELCWRLEAELIEQARVARARTATVPVQRGKGPA